jgi:hypothetical protein
MRHIRVTDPRAHELVQAIFASDAAMPVRMIEEVLTRGDAGLGVLVIAARESLERHRRPGYAHWSAIALGVLGDADAVPELATLARWAWRAPAIDVGFSAAEAIGRIGHGAEDGLLRYAELTPRQERYWFHYAAACMGTERAAAWLLGELERNQPLADSAALALAVLGRTDALPAIDRALRRARPRQLCMMAEAVKSLHRREPALGDFTRDWRLRYRYYPRFGRFPPLLPCLAALLRSHASGRAAAADEARGVPRSVEGIIEQAEHAHQREEPRCELCGYGRAKNRYGVVVCDDCAPAAARFQADCLLAVESRSNDIFDVLNVIDNQLMKHDTSGLPATEQYRRWTLAQTACHWLVEQGVESAAGGVAMLLAEAER